MSISKKIRKNVIAKKAPLSWLDKIMYICGYTLVLAISILSFALFALYIPQWIAYSDNKVIAYHSALLPTLCVLPLMFSTAVIGAFILGHGWTQKQPIIGRLKYQSTPARPIIPTYPLFSKAFMDNLSTDSKCRIKKYSRIAAFILCISALFLPFGLFPRGTMNESYQFKCYNSLNQITHSANIDDADQLVIEIYKGSTNHSIRTRYGVHLSIVFDDQTYTFSIGSFGEHDTQAALEYMLRIKSHFSEDEYRIENVKWMNALIADNRFSVNEIQLMYELFDYNEN